MSPIREGSQTGATNQDLSYVHPYSTMFANQSLARDMAHPPEPDDFDFLDHQFSEAEISDEQSDSDGGEGSSDTNDRPEQTEDMNYRETVWSIWSFMGWNHIPTL